MTKSNTVVKLPKTDASVENSLRHAGALYGSLNRLAGRMDISRQNINYWINTGRVPLLRALEIEALTEGRVTWKALCPAEYEHIQNSLTRS